MAGAGASLRRHFRAARAFSRRRCAAACSMSLSRADDYRVANFFEQLVSDDGARDGAPKPQNVLVHFFGTYDKTWVESIKKARLDRVCKQRRVQRHLRGPAAARLASGAVTSSRPTAHRCTRTTRITTSTAARRSRRRAPRRPRPLLPVPSRSYCPQSSIKHVRALRNKQPAPLLLPQNFLIAMEEAKAYNQTGELPKRMTGEFDPNDDPKQTRASAAPRPQRCSAAAPCPSLPPCAALASHSHAPAPELGLSARFFLAETGPQVEEGRRGGSLRRRVDGFPTVPLLVPPSHALPPSLRSLGLT